MRLIRDCASWSDSLSWMTVYGASLAWAALDRGLFLHLLFLLIVIVVALQRLLRKPLCLFPDLLRYLLMPALGRTVQVADPGQLQLELLVLVVIVGDVDDARGLLDTVLQRQLAVGEVELLEFRLGDLSSLASSGAVVALCQALVLFYTMGYATYPVQTTRLDHVQRRSTVLRALFLAT